MLDLTDDIENTAYYKSVMKETLLKAAQKLLKKGQSVEEIADTLDLEVEEVRKLAENQPQ
jgi:predicted transposase YdaD